MHLLLDKNNIVRCMASEECNLHKDKLEAGMRKVFCNPVAGIVGDKYDPETGVWEARPENYPPPSKAEVYELRIQDKLRELAIKALELEQEQKNDKGTENKAKEKIKDSPAV